MGGGRCTQSFGGKRQLGRLRHRREDIITMILQETGWGGMHGVHQNKDKWWALVNMVINKF